MNEDVALPCEVGRPVCVICKEEVNSRQEHSICTLPCGHFYGRSCVEAYFADGKRKSCYSCYNIYDRHSVRAVYVEDVSDIRPSQRQLKVASRIRRAEEMSQRIQESPTVKLPIALETLSYESQQLQHIEANMKHAYFKSYNLDAKHPHQLRKKGTVKVSGQSSLAAGADRIIAYGDTLKVIDMETLAEQCELGMDVSHAAVGTGNIAVVMFGQISLLDERSPEAKTPVGGFSNYTCLAWDGEQLASGSENGTIKIYDVRSPAEAVTATPAEGSVSRLCTASFGGLLSGVGEHCGYLRGTSYTELVTGGIIEALSGSSVEVRQHCGPLNQYCLYRLWDDRSQLVGCIPVVRDKSSIPGLQIRQHKLSIRDVDTDSTQWALYDGTDIFTGTVQDADSVTCIDRKKQPLQSLLWARCGLVVLSPSQLSVYS